MISIDDCDHCGQEANWHIYLKRAGTGDAPADVKLTKFQLCNRCYDYVAPVFVLFGWTVVSAHELETRDDE